MGLLCLGHVESFFRQAFCVFWPALLDCGNLKFPGAARLPPRVITVIKPVIKPVKKSEKKVFNQ